MQFMSESIRLQRNCPIASDISAPRGLKALGLTTKWGRVAKRYVTCKMQGPPDKTLQAVSEVTPRRPLLFKISSAIRYTVGKVASVESTFFLHLCSCLQPRMNLQTTSPSSLCRISSQLTASCISVRGRLVHGDQTFVTVNRARFVWILAGRPTS